MDTTVINQNNLGQKIGKCFQMLRNTMHWLNLDPCKGHCLNGETCSEGTHCDCQNEYVGDRCQTGNFNLCGIQL